MKDATLQTWSKGNTGHESIGLGLIFQYKIPSELIKHWGLMLGPVIPMTRTEICVVLHKIRVYQSGSPIDKTIFIICSCQLAITWAASISSSCF